MKINRNGWLVKFAYTHPTALSKLVYNLFTGTSKPWETGYIPSKTTLCRLFWRALILGPLANLAGIVLVVVLSALTPMMWVVSKIEQNAYGRRIRDVFADIAVRGIISVTGIVGQDAVTDVALMLKRKLCPTIRIE